MFCAPKYVCKISVRHWNIKLQFSKIAVNISETNEEIFLTISNLFVSEINYDLIEAAVASADTDDTNLYIDDGLDGFPSFGFRPGSEVKQPYRLYLPEKLPAEFTLVATFKPMSFRTSYLFAVLNPFETVVQLGIRISVSVTYFLS